MEDLSIVEVETTEEDYVQLGKKNPTNPTLKGGTWLHSYSCFKLDTPSGDLEDCQYCENGLNYMMKKGNEFFFLDKDELVDGQVDKVVLDTADRGVSSKLTSK